MNLTIRYFNETGDEMIFVRMSMTVLPEKRLEMSQTLQSMSGPVEKETGCLEHSVFSDILNENRFCILETWKHREDLDRHIATDRFCALLGAKVLLSEPLEIEIHTVTQSEGMAAVHKVRGRK